MIDAAVKLAFDDVTIDQLETVILGYNKSVLARDAAVIEDNVVFLGSADGIGAASLKMGFPASTCRFYNCKYRVQGNGNCKAYCPIRKNSAASDYTDL